VKLLFLEEIVDNKNTDLVVQAVEFLAVSAGTMETRPTVVMTFRPLPQHCWGVINFAVTKEQAVRMRNDLAHVIDNYPTMRQGDDQPQKRDPDPSQGTASRRRHRKGRKK
jgi:hypothetical protein